MNSGARESGRASAGRGRIPVTIITGFLGSGKTTLLNRILRHPEMARTAVVINEFGEIGLDQALAAASDDSIVVLDNGCLCCTVHGEMVGTMNRLYHQRQAGEIPWFDSVVIESSGLAEPGPVLQAFLSEPTLDGLYRVASVVALVDAVNGRATLDEHAEALRQVALADRLLVSKLDLVEAPGRDADEAELRARLKRLNPAAPIECVDDPQLSLPALVRSTGFDPSDPAADPLDWLQADAYQGAAGRGLHHDHPVHDHDHDWRGRDLESFCLVREEPFTRTALQFLLDGIGQNLGPNLLRVKGLVNVAEEPGRPAVIQGAQHLLHTMTWLDRWPDQDERTRIVFITQGIARAALQDMIELLDRVAARTAAARRRASA